MGLWSNKLPQSTLIKSFVILLLLAAVTYVIYASSVPVPVETVKTRLILSTDFGEAGSSNSSLHIEFKDFRLNYDFDRLPYNFTDRCNFVGTKAKVTSLIFVVSSASEKQNREDLRNLWANVNESKHLQDTSARIFFLLGKGNASDQSIQEEANKYDDMIIADVEDTYRNLVFKTAIILQLATTVCTTATFVHKIDDDVVFHIDKFFDHVGKDFIPNTTGIYGYVRTKTPPFRDPKNKWYISWAQFSGKVYPPFVTGSSYVMNTKTAQILYRALPYFPLINLEDVMITGIISEAISVPRIALESLFLPSANLKFVCPGTVISIHGVKTTRFYERVWECMKKPQSANHIFYPSHTDTQIVQKVPRIFRNGARHSPG